MKKGEKAVFTIRSDYAYGPEGSGDKIPGQDALVGGVMLGRDVLPDSAILSIQMERTCCRYGDPACYVRRQLDAHLRGGAARRPCPRRVTTLAPVAGIGCSSQERGEGKARGEK